MSSQPTSKKQNKDKVKYIILYGRKMFLWVHAMLTPKHFIVYCVTIRYLLVTMVQLTLMSVAGDIVGNGFYLPPLYLISTL